MLPGSPEVIELVARHSRCKDSVYFVPCSTVPKLGGGVALALHTP